MAAGDSAMPAGEDHTEDSVAGGGGQWRMLSGISIFDVPMARRRQTAAVALFCSGLFIVPVCFCTAVLLLWNIYTFPLIAAYLVFMLVDKAPVTGSRKSGHFRRWTMFTLFKDFFPITLHKTADLDPDGKYVIGYHPHGIIGIGAISSFGSEGPGISALLPGLNFFLCTLPINFRVPFLREVWLWMGMCDSSKHSFRNILSRGSGTVVVVVVGGAAEALQAAPGTMDLVLKHRRGFVRQALLNGAKLVPALGFGETDLFDVVTTPWMLRLQERMQKVMGFSMPLFHGRGVFNYHVGIMPHRRPINIVIGRAVAEPEGLERFREEISSSKGEAFLQRDPRGRALVGAYHAAYLHQLQELYDAHKLRFWSKRQTSMSIL